MKAKLNIKTIEGEEFEVEALVPDFIAWERHSKRKISDLVTGVAIEDMAFLAHNALKRQGTQKPFDGWIQSIAEIDMVEDDPKATKQAHYNGLSQKLRWLHKQPRTSGKTEQLKTYLLLLRYWKGNANGYKANDQH